MVLQALKWDISSVTPHDFLEHIVRRLPQMCVDDVDVVRRHAQTFITLCAAGTYDDIVYSGRPVFECKSIVETRRGLRAVIIARTAERQERRGQTVTPGFELSKKQWGVLPLPFPPFPFSDPQTKIFSHQSGGHLQPVGLNPQPPPLRTNER